MKATFAIILLQNMEDRESTFRQFSLHKVLKHYDLIDFKLSFSHGYRH